MNNGRRYRILPGIAALAIGAACLQPAAADEPATGAAPATSAAAPQFSGTNVTHTDAVVFAIDTGSNSVTLISDNGEPYNVSVDRSLGDVGRLQPGDVVDITYSRALLLRAEKQDSSGIRQRVDKDFATAPTAGSSMSIHRVEALTTIVEIQRGKHLLTLRGPTQTVTLQATSDKLLDGLKVGDSVHVDYIESTAVHILRDGAPLR